MGEINIRKAGREDLGDVLRLYQEPEFDDKSVLDLESAGRILARMQSYPNYTLYVAEERGEIIATFALLIMDNLAHMGARSGVLEDLSVRADRRGRGVGRQIMEFCLGQCCQAGCYKLALSSNVKRTGAHRFYDALGFNRYGVGFSVSLAEESPS